MIGKILFGLRVIRTVAGVIKKPEPQEEKAVEHLKSYVLPRSMTWIAGVASIGLGGFLMVKGDGERGMELFVLGLGMVGLRAKQERG